MTEGHRQRILAAIRQAVAEIPTAEAAATLPEPEERVSSNELATRFGLELERVGGAFITTRSEVELQHHLHGVIVSHGIKEAALSDAAILDRLGVRSWLATNLGPEACYPRQDQSSLDVNRKEVLARVQLGVTSCQFAIAETGTLLLSLETETSRLISLLPPVHVAIFTPQQLVATLAEALKRLRVENQLDPAVTLITGPSRTADIELTLTVGIHGPKHFYAILLDEPSAP